MKRVVLDTNFLMAPYQLKLDVLAGIHDALDEPYELCVLDGTIEELRKLLKSEKDKPREAAKFGLAFLDKHRFKVLESQGSVDDSLLALDNSHIVATQDSALRSRLRKQGTQTLYIRQKMYVKLE